MTKSSSHTILVTGANGFIGQGLCAALTDRAHRVITAGRQATQNQATPDRFTGDLARLEDHNKHITPALFEGVDQVVHLAAIAHRGGVTADAYDAVNHHASIALAKAASTAGCQRFIFLSSAKVLGDTGRDLTDHTPTRPADDYAKAKQKAEQALMAVSQASTMPILCLRPPLVHGAGAKANLARLIRLIDHGGVKGIPVPLGRTRNHRSLISRDHLVAAIIAVIEADEAPAGCYVVAEQPAMGTDDMIRALAEGMGRKAPLFSLPPDLLRWLLKVTGRQGLADRLLGDFSLDDSRFRTAFGWHALADTRQSLISTGRAIAQNKR
ncbi:MAG: NAD-dependent epimerase/dehydratase family protein [Pseudomonadota bacterium]